MKHGMMQKVKIKIAVPEDALLMAQADAQIFSDSWNHKSFSDSINNEREIVLSAFCGDSEEFAGYAAVSYIFDEANINRIAVIKKYRGNKLGTAMLEEIEKHLPDEVTVLNLEVRQSNSYAINMYKLSGYHIIGIRKKFYRAPDEDALLMTKRKV